jgi:predicted ArsR family transcriptional regulator
MNDPFASDLPLADQIQAVAAALIPVLRAFRAELGTERADAIAAKGLAEWRRSLARATGDRVVGEPREKWEKVAGDALEKVGGSVDIEDLQQMPEALRFTVTGCRLADHFRQLGEPELGYALLCAYDHTLVEEIAPDDVELKRTGTIMRGAPACDFHYRFKGGDGNR